MDATFYRFNLTIITYLIYIGLVYLIFHVMAESSGPSINNSIKCQESILIERISNIRIINLY